MCVCERESEREIERSKMFQLLLTLLWLRPRGCVWTYISMCVREREKGKERELYSPLATLYCMKYMSQDRYSV